MAKDPLKIYLDRMGASPIGSDIELEGTIVYKELIDPHHLLVLAKMKTVTEHDYGAIGGGIFGFFAFLFDIYTLKGVITCFLQFKKYFVSRENNHNRRHSMAEDLLCSFLKVLKDLTQKA